jgi:hypothetical protein
MTDVMIIPPVQPSKGEPTTIDRTTPEMRAKLVILDFEPALSGVRSTRVLKAHSTPPTLTTESTPSLPTDQEAVGFSILVNEAKESNLLKSS